MCIQYSINMLILVLTISLGLYSTLAEDLVVSVKQGKLLGIRLKSRMGNDYIGFRGIPYGEAPVRFEPAVPAKGWEGIRNATEFGPICPQYCIKTRTHFGEENCLFLNVYTPTIKGRSKLSDSFPVVMFTHGGAFQYESGNDYGATYMIDEEVILVTHNYRLGILGFLSTGDDVIQGNMGLKDETLVLKWIQENIHSFGGDPTRVTLMGTSSAAAQVSFQILSPLNAGLFHRAVPTSGSVLSSWAMNINPRKTAHEIAEYLDCPKEPSSALAKCLREMDFRKLLKMTLTKWNMDPLCSFTPVIETLRPGQSPSDVALAEDPLILLSEGRFNKIPIITGLMEDEGLLFHSSGILKSPELQRTLNEDWNHIAPITLNYDFSPEVSEQQLLEISRSIRGYYFGQQKIGPESSRNLTNLYSDRYFNHGVKKAALLMAKYTPVYVFIMGFHGDFSMIQLLHGEDVFKEPLGIGHGDDIQYLFDSRRFRPFKENSKSEEFSKLIVKLWTSFAKTGNTMESVGSMKVPWMPISLEEIKRQQLKWYGLDLRPKMIVREPFKERLEFWDRIDAQLRYILNSNQITLNMSPKGEL